MEENGACGNKGEGDDSEDGSNGIRAQGMDMKNKSKILLSSETLRWTENSGV